MLSSTCRSITRCGIAATGVLMGVLLGCGRGDSASPGVTGGDEIVIAIAEEGESIDTTIFKVHELEPDDGMEALALLPHRRIIDDLRAGTRVEQEALPGGIDHVMSFLQAHWDGHIGGESDAGVNSFEFVRLLQKHDIAPVDFLQEFEDSNAKGMAVGRFVAALDSVSTNLPASSPDRFLTFLHSIRLGMSDFLTSTERCYPTWDDYLRAMNSQQMDFDVLLERYNDSGDDACAALNSAQGATALGKDGVTVAHARTSSGQALPEDVRLTKAAWTCVQNNVPECGDRSAVLNASDLHAENYGVNSDICVLQEKRIPIKAEIHCIKNGEADWEGRGKWTVDADLVVLYDACHPRIPGKYIKEISLEHVLVNGSPGKNGSCNVGARVHLKLMDGLNQLGPDPKVHVLIDFEGEWKESSWIFWTKDYSAKVHQLWCVQASKGILTTDECKG